MRNKRRSAANGGSDGFRLRVVPSGAKARGVVEQNGRAGSRALPEQAPLLTAWEVSSGGKNTDGSGERLITRSSLTSAGRTRAPADILSGCSNTFHKTDFALDGVAQHLESLPIYGAFVSGDGLIQAIKLN